MDYLVAALASVEARLAKARADRAARRAGKASGPVPHGAGRSRGYDLDAAVRLYEAGNSVSEVARILSADPRRVYEGLKSAGVEMRPTSIGFKPYQIDDMVARYLRGESTRDIGAAYDRSYQTIASYLRQRGVKMRSTTEHFRKSTFTNGKGWSP